MRATAKDLRFHSAELLGSVSRGEEVVITYHGRPCAKLVPVDDSSARPETADTLFGMWSDNASTEDVDAYVRTLRKGRFDVG